MVLLVTVTALLIVGAVYRRQVRQTRTVNGVGLPATAVIGSVDGATA
jgi:hypothetical protein